MRIAYGADEATPTTDSVAAWLRASGHQLVRELVGAPWPSVGAGVAQAVVGAGYGLVELRPMRMSLEEIFLQLTTTDAPETEVAHA